MGSDPFWPTYVASINVLCVPVADILPQRFAQILKYLNSVQEVRFGDLASHNVFQNELIGASKYAGGSIFYTYNTSVTPSDATRFPLEPNASPQVILGFSDSHSADLSSEDSVRNGADHSIAVNDLYEKLKESYGSSRNGGICRLIVVDATRAVSIENVLSVRSDEPSSFREAMQTLSYHLVESIGHFANILGDIELIEQRNSIASRPTTGDGDSKEVHVAKPQDRPENDEAMNSVQNSISRSQQPVTHHKGRYTILLGLLNLYIGSWPDAMRRLDEGASLAREAEDSLWQARALECLVVCMALLAWKGETFEVPEVCIKALSTSQLLARSTSFPSQTYLGPPSQMSTASNLTPPRKWAKYAPSVTKATFDLYSSLLSNAEVRSSAAAVTESRIRLGNILLFATSHGNTIDAAAFECFFLERRIADSVNRAAGHFTFDSGIANLMLDVLSTPVDETTESHILAALAAVISSLSQVGSSRRHAFLFRGLLLKLIPILIQARKVGASEAGIHPASALSATNNTRQEDSQALHGGFRALLEAASQSYGIQLPEQSVHSSDLATSNEQLKNHLKSWYHNRKSGDIALKLDILQLCVSASDALPDLQASLEYASSTLRCGLGSLTISTNSVSVRPSLLPEEQTRLVEGLKRVVATAERLGFDNIRAGYWDDFLVRDIYAYQPADAAKLSSHKPSELSLVEEGRGDAARDPFIFNPFAKAASAETSPVIVAGELVTFSVILQNPLEIEIDVQDISLLTEGCDFESTRHSILLGPFWSQAFSLTGTPRKSGQLKVKGCRATVSGCYQKDFPVLVEDWQPPLTIKQKSSGLNTGVDRAAEATDILEDLKVPTPKVLSVEVIEPQPHLTIMSPDLPQPSVMLLEGEKRTFELVVTRESRTVPTDFLLFTSDDNVTSSLQEALGKKDLPSTDTYEIQYQLKERPTIKIVTEDPANLNSDSSSSNRNSYRIDLFGRPGLTNAVIQIDFAYLGVPRSQVTETFYTRQKRFPLAVTVNGSIDIPRCNVLPVQDNFPWLGSKRKELEGPKTANADSILGEEYCMLSLDLRNVWPHTLSVELTSKLRTAVDQNTSNGDSMYRVLEDLQPGHVTRVILLLPRLFIQDPHAPVPNLITQRQYVVSASKLSLEAEAASRENFWYREELLKQINGTWKEVKTGRHGQIDLRKGIRLNPRIIDVLRIEHVDISFTMFAGTGSFADPKAFQVKGKSHFSVRTETFVTLRVQVLNRSKERLRLLLRLQPALRDQPHNIALDLSRRLAWTGVLQQALHPPLEPGDSREAHLGLVVFAEGNYEVSATVEEVKGRAKNSIPARAEGVGTSSERRIWHSRSPCLIDAVDEL